MGILKIGLLAIAMKSSLLFAAPLAQNGTYALDPDHTNIGFEVSHLGVSFVVGRFDKFTGDVSLTANGATSINVAVEVSSVDTKVPQRDQHLLSKDFFNVSQFPKMTFVSTSVEYDTDGNPKTVHGDLSLHGVTKPLVLTLKPIGAGPGPLGENRVGFHATGTLKRTDYGMNNLLAIAGDEITITLNIEAIKQ